MRARARFFALVALAGAVAATRPAVAQIVLVEEGGVMADGNLAIEPGAVAFAPDALLGFEAIHNISNLNDGLYGNSESWIGQTGLFVGLRLAAAATISSFAFGRDNGGEEQVFTDRSLGRYVLQVTTIEAPDELTPEEEWATVGEIVYAPGVCPFSAHLRHRFNFPPVEATGVRLVVPGTGIGAGTCIDELEVYEELGDDQGLCPAFDELELIAAGGPVTTPAASGDVPTLAEGNLSRAADAVPFGTPPHPAPVHEIEFLNDGIYGNARSWLGNESGATTGETYAGIYFQDGPRTIEEIALGRDSLGEFTDRAVGPYTVEFTADTFDFNDDAAIALASWSTLGQAAAHIGDGLPSLRHHYRLPRAVSARAVRVITLVQNAIDEIELGKIVVDREPGFPPLEILETGGPKTTPAAPGDVPAAADRNLARAIDAVAFASPGLAGTSAGAVNDGVYGDGAAWVGEEPAGALGLVYAGVRLLDRPRFTSAIAIGRDNTGARSDRATGRYIVQATLSDVDVGDPLLVESARWTTLGQAEDHIGATAPGLRRLYDLGTVQARAVRVIVEPGTAIDEIEVFETETATTLELIEAGGFLDAAGDLALLPGATAFAIDALVGFEDIHAIGHLNDGLYGNSNSWIGQTGSPGHAGIRFGESFTIASIAFGRDNGGEPMQFTDRSVGPYVIQVTTEPDAGPATPDAAWRTVGELLYDGAFPPDGQPWLRHRYCFDAVEATAVRILVPGVGLDAGTCIDEIEVYEDCEPGAGAVCEDGIPELTALEVGGPFATPSLPFDVPLFADGNLAMAPDAVPFATPAHPAPAHEIAHLNDGFYGNDRSWLGVEPGLESGLVYAGIYFQDGPRAVGEIALGRDNLGIFLDRAAGCHVVEVTTDELDPTSDAAVALATWTTLGQAGEHLKLTSPAGLRRRYGFAPISARAVRVVTSVQNVLDEIELYSGDAPPPPGRFLRGDSNGDGETNISDAPYLLNFLFLGGPDPLCADAADANDDGAPNISDASFLLNFLFLGGPEPPPPFGACGADGTADGLDCAEFAPCG